MASWLSKASSLFKKYFTVLHPKLTRECVIAAAERSTDQGSNLGITGTYSALLLFSASNASKIVQQINKNGNVIFTTLFCTLVELALHYM